MLREDLFLFWFPWYRISKVLESKGSSWFFSDGWGKRRIIAIVVQCPKNVLFGLEVLSSSLLFVMY
jgi:hypothetical protein